MTPEVLGFVGLGNMGRPMATHLVAAGHDVVTYDAAGPDASALDGATVATFLQSVKGYLENPLLLAIG